MVSVVQPATVEREVLAVIWSRDAYEAEAESTSPSADPIGERVRKRRGRHGECLPEGRASCPGCPALPPYFESSEGGTRTLDASAKNG